MSGYEIHIGITKAVGDGKPVIALKSRNQQPVNDFDGWQSADGKIKGVYLHGLFDDCKFTSMFLAALRPGFDFSSSQSKNYKSYDEYKQQQYDLLAEHFKKHINMEKLDKIIGLSESFRPC